MNVTDKYIINVQKYGTPRPSVFKRIFGGLFGNDNFIRSHSSHEFWTALYRYNKATKKELIEDGYAKNPTVYAVVSLIAKKAALAPWQVYKVKSARAYNRLKALQEQPYSAKRELEISICKEDALQAYDNHYLNEILLNPNPQQGQAEYMENLFGFKLITGDAYEFAEFKDNGKDIQNMWVLPSHNMKILTDNYDTFPMRERGYVLEVGSKQQEFKPNQINHSKYWSPYYYGDGSHLYGFSPLESAWISTLQSNHAREAAIEQLQNRGVRGIFTVESDKIQSEQSWLSAKDQLHIDWQNNSKNYKDKIMPIFGRGQWHNVGLSIKDLAIIETAGMTDRDICNVYGVSPILLGDNSASTFDNYKTASKELVTRCVLPLLSSIRSSRNKKLLQNGDWNSSNDKIVVDFDPTVFTELYDDVFEMAKDMRAIGVYTDNEIRIATNYEGLDYPFSDDVWKRTNDIPTSLINKDNYGQRSNNQGAGEQEESDK